MIARKLKVVFFALLLAAAVSSQVSLAQQGNKPLPITNGTSKTAMDAPDSNNDLETYTHSPVVQSLARHLGLPTNRASRYFEDANSAVLILVVLYYALKLIPAKLRDKRKGIDADLVRARQATADAEARLKRVESRLAALDGEVDVLRQQAATAAGEEETRIRASLEEERQRIVHSAEAEIAAAQANAERGLKRYASDLAVDRAAARVELTPESDGALVDEFLRGLAAQLREGPAAGATFQGKN